MRTFAPLLRPMAATAALLIFVTAATAAQPAPAQQPAQPSAQGQPMQPGAPMYPGGPAWPGGGKCACPVSMASCMVMLIDDIPHVCCALLIGGHGSVGAQAAQFATT